MRILHVINTLHTGGAERLLVDMIPAMVKEGHEVEVAVLNQDDSALMQELRETGIQIHIIKMPLREYNPLQTFRLIPLMKRFDVVHAHLFPSQYWVALASLFLSRKPVLVTTEHSTGNTRADHQLTTHIDRWIYTHYDGVFCISEGTEQFMRTRVSDRTLLMQVNNGIPLARFRHVTADRSQMLPSVPADKILLMQVARFGIQKNQDCVIRALAMLPDRYHLVFVGSGVREEACRQLAKELLVDSRITFLGDRDDVPILLSIADMVIMSSKWEGFGLSAAEAMAAGRIVLASDVPGLSQVVADPELRFPENDSRKLKELILKYTDVTLRQKKEEWGSRWVCQYDITYTVRHYLEKYQYLYNKKNGKE